MTKRKSGQTVQEFLKEQFEKPNPEETTRQLNPLDMPGVTDNSGVAGQHQDSYDELRKKAVVVNDGRTEKKTDTRTFKIGPAPIGKFRGNESPEFAIMTLIKRTEEYQGNQLTKNVQAPLEFREGSALELLLIRVELDGKKFSLIGEAETTTEKDGEIERKKEVYGNYITAPYKVVIQSVEGQGNLRWVEPAFPETMTYKISVGEHALRVISGDKTEKILTEEEQQKAVIYAQLNQYGTEESFTPLAADRQVKHEKSLTDEKVFNTDEKVFDAHLDSFFSEEETAPKPKKPQTISPEKTRKLSTRLTKTDDHFKF